MYDIIGDIHGHADELTTLLEKMGYTRHNGSYSHPSRKALFLGDYIDRGPQIPQTLKIVRSMVEHNQAIALMGNHEYNAICYNTKDQNGNFLREHSEKNYEQHRKTLSQLTNSEYNDHIEWFKSLPLLYESESFRAVHASWSVDHINFLRHELNGHLLTDAKLLESGIKNTSMYNAIEEVLKGKEVPMPNGKTFKDKDKNLRHEVRIKWWLDPATTTLKDLSIPSQENMPEIYMDTANGGASYYLNSYKPVFFGHYWLNGTPALQKQNVCCLDYSVARGGKLVAYRHHGEQVLSNGNFIHA